MIASSRRLAIEITLSTFFSDMHDPVRTYEKLLEFGKIPKDALVWEPFEMMDTEAFIDAVESAVEYAQEKIEQHYKVLEDRDYTLADGGCWVSAAGVAVRILALHSNKVSVSAYREGDEMGDLLGTFSIDGGEL